MNGNDITGKRITIPMKVFDALLSDAGWRVDLIDLDTIRVYHRYYGDIYTTEAGA